jgi:uroporphyrin-III C-methyltransferase
MNATRVSGKVIIIGAGPGDPELITLKAYRWLKRAEVVITDRLVSDVILQDYVNKNAQILNVGKQSGKGGSTPQPVINELMVDYATQGKLVIRLKGGDISVFSNVFDELSALVQNNISYEIIPGITAACGAAAYAGIPLTARNHSNAVRFLTHYKAGLPDNNYWNELAHTEDTLVFYMSSDHIDELVTSLADHQIDQGKHIAVIEQATTPMQNVFCSTIHDYLTNARAANYVSPTLIIIGKVAGLHQQFKWIANSGSRENYFKPVQERAFAAARA